MIRRLIVLLIPTAIAAQSLVGDWHTGKTDTPLEIHISKSRRGYIGEVRNMDYPEVALPLAGIVAQKHTLRFEVPAAKAAFEGTLKDATTLEGSWTQPGIHSMLRFERGKWTPALAAGRPFPPNLDIQVRAPPTPVPAGGAY